MYTVSATIVLRVRKEDVSAEDEDSAMAYSREWIEAAHMTVCEVLRKAGFSVETRVEYNIAYETAEKKNG